MSPVKSPAPPGPDARLPVFFGSPGPRDAALLIEGDAPAPDGAAVARFRPGHPRLQHRPGCACCLPRGAVAAALGQLFQARARGDVPFFRAVRVLASPGGELAVRAALDPGTLGNALALARFRLARPEDIGPDSVGPDDKE